MFHQQEPSTDSSAVTPASNDVIEVGLRRTLRACIVVLIAAPAAAYLSGRINLLAVSDADHLMLAELLPSLANGTEISEWTIPLANYLIPDWPLYAIAVAGTGSPTAAIATFMTLQTALLATAINSLARTLHRPTALAATVAGLSVLVFFTVSSAIPSVYLGSSYNHFGTAILVLFALTLALRWSATQRPLLLVASAVLSFVAIFSDRLFVVWFLAPAAAAILLLALANRLPRPAVVKWLGAHLAAALIALPLPGIFFPQQTDYPVLFGYRNAWTGLLDFLSITKRNLLDDQPQSAVIIALTLIAIYQLWARRTLFGAKLNPDMSVLLTLFVLAQGIGVSVAMAAMNRGVTPHVRHFLILFVFPLIVVPVVSFSGRGIAEPRVRAPFAAVAIAALSIVQILPDVGNLSAHRPTVPISCIESAATASGGRYGIASYWDARPIEVFSSHRLDVATVTPALVEDRTNADLSEFDRSYDFAVTSTHIPGWIIPPSALEQRAGPPLSETTCGQYTVRTWSPGQLDLHPTDDVGFKLAFSACQLPSQLSTPSAQCTLAASESAEDGFLTYGPYVPLSPGKYKFELEMRSSAERSVPVALWDAVYDGDTENPAQDGELYGTTGQWISVPVEIVVP